ncbi:hypothetical protein E2P81_ATG01666 [Venturia nashicola]|nr:hypothetical protein E2P81_ATG01666 [Venturia nashicola]
MRLNVVLVGHMAFVSSAVPVKDTSCRAIIARGGQYNDSSIGSVTVMHVVPASDSYAYNANKVSIRDSNIDPPFVTCFDLFEEANMDATGPKMLGVCSSSPACLTIVDPNKSKTQQILKTIGSIRVEGNTTCGVYESDNCQEGTLRETISEKNMLSWPPVIPFGSWRASVHCYRFI